MEYGISCDNVSRVYLAGGFGEKVNVKKAAGIGLIPEELAEKAIPVGNSSLAGAVMIAQDPLLRQRFSDVAANTEEISLAGNSLFQELYMEYMLFPEEA